jgi:hypothetical protein
MDLSQQLQNVGREFAELRKLMKHAESLELEPHERQLLTALGTALDGTHADLQAQAPAAIADIARQEKELIADVKQTQEGLAQAEQELKAFLAAAPAVAAVPASPAPPALDPQHGGRLARELLDQFTDPKPVAVPLESRTVAEMHAAEFSDPDEWHFGME